MRHRLTTRLCVVVGCTALIMSCAPQQETTKEVFPRQTVTTKESLYRRGHQLYLNQELDSATTLLKSAVVLDSTYIDPLIDLAQLHYDLAMRAQSDAKKRELSRYSRDYYVRIDRLGRSDSDVYERLCELSVILGDDGMFLTYARKNVERYPYDRQYHNLGLAYFNVGDYQNVIKTQKESTEKFKLSPYIGGFFRQLGRAYQKIDRDQTAERTFDAGVKTMDEYVARQAKARSDFNSSADYKRLMDDKVGMLMALRKLHTTYKALDKLEKVDRQLKALGR